MRGLASLAILVLFPLALAAPFNPVYLHPPGRSLQRRAAQDDAQSSLTLDKSQVQNGLKKDGQQDPAAGQAPSLTSSNNFLNFCLTQKNVSLTNGAQVKGGSCNPTIMGRIIAQNVMPSSKFVFPANLDDSLKENEAFTVKMAVQNLQTGQFVNAEKNYFAAPAQVNDQGHLIGHSHFVIQAIPSMNSTTVLDPTKFAFFQGLNAKAVNGLLSANVTKGLPAGTYRMGSINTAANHQPALVAVAQHGMLDDVVYFTVKKAASHPGSNGVVATSKSNSRPTEGSSQCAGNCTGSTPAPKAMAPESTMHQAGHMTRR